MNLKDMLINVCFGNVIESRVTERLKAASTTDVEYGWRRLTGNADRIFFPPLRPG